MDDAVRISNLSKVYPNGHKALDSVSLTVASGEFIGILGTSGAGKSTLLRSINGFETPTLGEIFIGQLQVTPKSLGQVRRRVGMVFQNFGLVPSLNALTNVAIGRLAHVPALMSLFYLFPKRDLELAAKALDSVGLLSFAYSPAGKLSGGQQQRVAIARSMVQEAAVILADEPVASLDPVTGDEIMFLLQKLGKERGVTVIASLHQVDLAQRFCDRIVGLQGGKLVFSGGASDLQATEIGSLYQREAVVR